MSKKLIIVAVFLVILDQVTKYLAQAYLPLHQAIDIIPFFSLYLTYNEGIAFSFLSGLGSTPLIVLTLAIIVFMIVLWRQVPHHQKFASLGFALVVAGAVGNLIDRVTQGRVVDFFLFHTESWSFAVFNVADSYITIGAACIILQEVIAFFSKSNETNATAVTNDKKDLSKDK